jgi:two-component system, NarL family, nitrate/nitrite response regulator NarL
MGARGLRAGVTMLTMRDPNQGPIRVLALADPGLGARTLERLREAQSEGLWLMGNASSLEDAVALIVTTDPQVIVIDVDGEYGPDTIADLGERSDARLIALTCSRDAELQDGAILAGARGVVEKRQAAEFLVAAIRCVHEGEMWINHAAADRILDELAHARKRAEQQERIRVKLSRLTLKERIIATEITRSDSATPREIAARLQISEHRLQVYLAAIQRKLELSDGEARMSGSQPRPVTLQPVSFGLSLQKSDRSRHPPTGPARRVLPVSLPGRQPPAMRLAPVTGGRTRSSFHRVQPTPRRSDSAAGGACGVRPDHTCSVCRRSRWSIVAR